jgi:AraC-like DNA-binding protein
MQPESLPYPIMIDNQDGRERRLKPFGAGRSVYWRGGSVWVGDVRQETGFHEHHAIQLTLALPDGEVRFRQPGGDWIAYRTALVAAHQSHAFDASGQLVALLFTEPESRAGRVLRERYRSGIAALEAYPAEAQALAAAYRDGAPDEELAACARAILARLVPSAAPAPAIDHRIERAIELLRERLGETVLMSEIAAAVHLSPERFRHLFQEETGIRFRPYVLWLRLELAVSAFAAGASVTEAAHAGGFADSAHFSRTVKRMFGVQPGGVQRAAAD